VLIRRKDIEIVRKWAIGHTSMPHAMTRSTAGLFSTAAPSLNQLCEHLHSIVLPTLSSQLVDLGRHVQRAQNGIIGWATTHGYTKHEYMLHQAHRKDNNTNNAGYSTDSRNSRVDSSHTLDAVLDPVISMVARLLIATYAVCNITSL
jgi:hypothetical protein